MISCTSWVPRGVADPNPKRFEYSRPELEMIKELERESAERFSRSKHSRKVDDEEEEIDELVDESDEGQVDGDAKAAEAKAKEGEDELKSSDLPKEFRMDEYSSSSDEDDGDDDDDGATSGGGAAANRKVGNLLVGLNESEMMVMGDGHGGDDEDEEDEDEDDAEGGDDDVEHDSYDDDVDDDDLDDVEDGREYLPVDVGGVQSMRLGGDDTLNFAGGMYDDDEDDDDDSDVEDTNLMADDALLLVAKTDEDFSSLEVYVYEQNGSGNLFVHHDIPLPSYPLCLAHGDINHRGEAGNFCAVGMFTPGIEIWNLDVLDALEPACVLGGTADGDYGTTLPAMPGTTGKKKKQKKAGRRKNGLREGSHTDAVMALSWNAVHRHVIASGSADRTVKIWDVTRAGGGEGDGDGHGGAPPATPAATFRHHKDKVQGVAWHPVEGTILATGSFDRTVTIVDARCRDGGGGDGNVNGGAGTGRLPADCEAIAWDPHRTECLSAASEDGSVTCWDIRKFGRGNGGTGGGGGGRRGGDDTALWSFVAHEFGGVSDLSYNGHVPGLMATCAIDKTVALWDTHHLSTSETSSSPPSPHACGSKDMGVGKLYSVSFYPSAPWLLGCGGGGNQPALWDLEGVETVQKRFGERYRSGVDSEGSSSQLHDSKRAVIDFDEIMTGTGGNTAGDDADAADAADRVREKMEKKTKKKDGGGGKRRKKKAHRR